MKDDGHDGHDGSSVALPLIIVAVFMAAVMAGGFFFVRRLHIAVEPSAAPAPLPIPTTGPGPTPIPTPTFTPPPLPTPTLGALPTPTVVVSPEPGTPANVLASISRLQPGFRICYKRGLAVDPTLSGDLVIEIEIDSSGDVARVSKVGGLGLGTDVESCIMRRARGATFDAPGGSGTKVRVPLKFASSVR